MILFKKKLKPSWTFKSGKKVWRLLTGDGVLVAELRDTDQKTTEFIGIDLSSGSVLWNNNQLEEKWWTTLNIIYRDTILLQQFSRPDMPTSERIFALDLHTGILLWQNQEVSFMNVSDDTIYCLKKSFSSETIIGLNFRTGIELGISPADLSHVTSFLESEVVLPEPIDESAENLSEQIDEGDPAQVVRRIARAIIPPDSKDPTLLKLGQKNVISFYARAENNEKGGVLYDTHLIVTDWAGKIVFRDIADKKVHATLADFYFGVGGQLIYIKNSDEIVALKLD